MTGCPENEKDPIDPKPKDPIVDPQEPIDPQDPKEPEPKEEPLYPGMLTQTEFRKALEDKTLPLASQVDDIISRLEQWLGDLYMTGEGFIQRRPIDAMIKVQGGLRYGIRNNSDYSDIVYAAQDRAEYTQNSLGTLIGDMENRGRQFLFEGQAAAYRAANYFKAWDKHSQHTTQDSVNAQKATLEQAFQSAEDNGCPPIPRDNLDQAIAMLDGLVRTNMRLNLPSSWPEVFNIPVDLVDMFTDQFRDLSAMCGKVDIYSELGYSTEVTPGRDLQNQQSRSAIQKANGILK